MTASTLNALEPRKTPVQARAAATVEAIFEAAIQVLLTQGADRLTTTRVADRAGVSVGTLYQYFPNKQSLMYAVFEDHLGKVTTAVERACADACHKPLAEMIHQVVDAFVDAKISRADVSSALYQVAADVGGAAVLKRSIQRTRRAMESMLDTAPGIVSPPDRFAIEIMQSAIGGVMRSALEQRSSPAALRKIKQHLVILCQSYMQTALTQN